MKLLIVDDEMIIREGMSRAIDWEAHGFELLRPAVSAEEAWARIPQERPDLIFTDIRMNGRSGLELAREVKTAYPETEIVVLSGYSDFEYAQQAIKEGVSDYLLKKSRRDDILRTALRIRERLLERRRERQDSQLLERWLLADDLPGGRLSEQLRSRYPELAEAEAAGEPMQVLLVAADDAEACPPQESCSVLTRRLGGPSALWKGHAIVVVRPARAGAGELSARVRAALRELAQRSEARLCCAAGSEEYGLEGLKTSFERATAALRYRDLLEDTDYVAYDEVSRRSGIRTVCSIDEENALIAVLKQGNAEALGAWVEARYAALRGDPEATPASLSSRLHSLYVAAQRWLDRTAAALGAGEPSPSEQPSHAEQPGVVTGSWLTMRLLAVQEAYLALTQGQSSYVQSAARYIREHLQEPISLQEVSEHVHVHPHYLSELFKRETGQNYSLFVTKERITRAMALLLETPAKIAEVARRVGYQDVKHFTQLFKRHTGQTPTDYRSAGGGAG
ncbi:response regulator [Paenibacillus sp. IB182496]|uniref:Response regulator n=1 Tax=Paenibacillus sabuli TaxID=2772509 RepID=A0A927BQY6_9BACL|nr:response regulator [Paenibacillus sabuli]MBD2844075.1 response regulator [Paenibacillus sabuli]